MKETYEALELCKETSKNNKPYDVLKVRYTKINGDGAVVELMEGRVFPKRGVIYTTGQKLTPEIVVSRSRNGFFEVGEFNLVPSK